METVVVVYADYLESTDFLAVDTESYLESKTGTVFTDINGNKYQLTGRVLFSGPNAAYLEHPTYCFRPLQKYNGEEITELRSVG